MSLLTFPGRRRRREAGGHSTSEYGPGEHRGAGGGSLSRSPTQAGVSERRPGT
jgi:hypothetical protein